MALYPVLEVFSKRVGNGKRGNVPVREMVAYVLPDDGFCGLAPLVVIRRWKDGTEEVCSPDRCDPEVREAYRRTEAANGLHAFLMYLETPDDRQGQEVDAVE